MSDIIQPSENKNLEENSCESDFLKRLQEKYENAYMDFALNGYKKSVARALCSLNQENRQKVLSSYSQEFSEEIRRSIDQLRNEGTAYTKRELNHIITQQNIIHPQDFVNIEEYLKSISPLKLKYALETIREIDSRLFDFANKLVHSELTLNYVKLMNSEEIQALLNTVNMYSFKIVFKYADEEFKNNIISNISKNRAALLEEDVSCIQECSQKKIAEAKENLIADIIEMDKRRIIKLSRFNNMGED